MTQGTPDTNISTEHQKEGDALKPSDTLDRGQTNGTGADAAHDRADSRSSEDKDEPA